MPKLEGSVWNRVGEFCESLKGLDQYCLDYILNAQELKGTPKTQVWKWLNRRFVVYSCYRRAVKEGRVSLGLSKKQVEDQIINISNQLNKILVS